MSRERNALVAEKVMGWVPWSGGYYYGTPDGNLVVCMEPGDAAAPHWSPFTSIADAWLVVEKMNEKGMVFAIKQSSADKWWVAFKKPALTARDFADTADTAPEAICRAALAVVEGK